MLYTIDNSVSGNHYDWSISQGQGTYNNTSSTTATGVSNIMDWSNIPTLPSYAQIEVLTKDENGCEIISRKNIFECCGKNDPTNLIDETISEDITFTDKTVVINGVLTIDANVIFDVSASNLQNHIIMGPEAKIIVKSGKSITFDNTTIISECDFMWDGIYLNGGSSNINFTNSKMHDAINGIVADNGAVVNITNSEFINNYKSVQISNYIPNAMNPVNYSGSITGSSFYTENDISNNGSMIIPENDNDYMLKLAPYSGKQSYAGIMLNKVGLINIGDGTANQNLFAKQRYGIYSITSNPTIRNNKFLYIKKKTNNGQVNSIKKLPESAAIYGNYNSANYHFTGINKVMNIGDLSLSGGSYSNLFDYCYIGVYANNYRTKLYRNKLENTSNTALYLYDIITSTDIQYNYINSNSRIQNARGIYCANTTSRNLKLNIENNYIYKAKWGISLTNCSSFNFSHISLLVKVNNNTIMLNPTNRIKRYAIKAASCDRIEIRENTITRLGTSSSEDATKVVGISLRQTQSAKVTDNYIFRMGSGIMTNGAMFNTQFFCNTFSNTYNGFYFGDETALTNFGWKNVSGITDFNPQNKWINCFGEKMFNHDIIGPAVDYYYYDQNWSSGYSTDFDPEILPGSVTSQKILPIESNQASFYCSNSNGPIVIIKDDELSSDVDRDALLKEFKMGVEYSELQAEFRSYEIDYLYKVLDNEPAVMWLGSIEDESYVKFYDEYKHSINAKFIDIDNLINGGSYAKAFEINNSIVANTTMDLNRKVSNKIYLESYIVDNYALDENTIKVLTNIAIQSPYKGGYGVYTARIMLDFDPDENGVSWRIAEQTNEKEETQIRVFPNPVKDVLFIEVQSEMDSYGATLEVYNAMGQNILNKKLNNKMEFINLESFTTGLYIYSIKYENGHSEKGKFIVK